MIKHLINWLFPMTCIVCDFPSPTAFCTACFKELPWLEDACITCAKNLSFVTDVKQCGECLIDPPPFSVALLLFNYRSPITSLIGQLKFHNKLRFAKPLGELLARRIEAFYTQSALTLPECIIPVPLHPHRLRKRGYNQAIEIAKAIKSHLNIPIDYQSAQRIISTQPQTLLAGAERQKNVKNAFTVKKEFQVNHIALVDDVATTFSTLIELAHTFQKQGIKRIDAWCLAKAH